MKCSPLGEWDGPISPVKPPNRPTRLLDNRTDDRDVDSLDGCNEPVASTLECLDVTGRLGQVTQRTPDFGHRFVQSVIEVHEDGVRPERFAKRLSGNELRQVDRRAWPTRETVVLAA